MNADDVIVYLAGLSLQERKALFLKASTLYRKQEPLKVGDIVFLDVDLLEDEQRANGDRAIEHYKFMRDDPYRVIAINPNGTYHVEDNAITGRRRAGGVWVQCKREYLILR